MVDQTARAEEFEQQAEKKLGGWGLFCSKYEDAADLFDKAANAYKLSKSYAWKTSLLLRVKEAVKAKELEDDDLT